MTNFRRCSHAYPACVAARLGGELYGDYEMCPKEAAENEPSIRAELAEDAAAAAAAADPENVPEASDASTVQRSRPIHPVAVPRCDRR
jgi:hypothetical protein